MIELYKRSKLFVNINSSHSSVGRASHCNWLTFTAANVARSIRAERISFLRSSWMPLNPFRDDLAKLRDETRRFHRGIAIRCGSPISWANVEPDCFIGFQKMRRGFFRRFADLGCIPWDGRHARQKARVHYSTIAPLQPKLEEERAILPVAHQDFCRIAEVIRRTSHTAGATGDKHKLSWESTLQFIFEQHQRTDEVSCSLQRDRSFHPVSHSETRQGQVHRCTSPLDCRLL